MSLFRFIFALVTLQQTFHITKHVTNITILFQGVDNKMENLDFVTKKELFEFIASYRVSDV